MTSPSVLRTLTAVRRAEKDMTYLLASLSAAEAVALDERHPRKDHRHAIDENTLLEQVPEPAPARFRDRTPRIPEVKPARAKVA